MQLSHYIKTYPVEEKPGYFILFSTKRASKVLISGETFQSIQNGTVSSSDASLLEKLGMLTADTEEEIDSVINGIDTLNKNNRLLRITIVLNLDCNFACPYCFEEGIKGRYYMSDTTRNDLLEFIKARFTGDKDTLLIDFYGGEPLLSVGLIESVSKSIRPYISSKKGSYYFSLVTNGSLFTKKTAGKLVPLGLKSVKITIDGPAEIHNRSRPFKSGAGSFNTIIKNIRETWGLVNIDIGGNYTRDNYKQFVLLLDYFKSIGLGPDNFSVVKFDPIVNTPGSDTSVIYYKSGCISIDEPWLIKADAFLREEILKRGYFIPKPGPTTCMIESNDFFVINYDGTIYKCPVFNGKDGYSIGDVKTGVNDYKSSYNLGLWKNNEECKKCKYLPLCYGGCRYMTFVRDGNVDRPDCKKAYFDSSLETMVKQDIKYRL